MSRNKQRKHRSIKRLKHNRRQLINLPLSIINENIPKKSSNYVKYFNYSLPELLADHSTDPMQNTARQYPLLDIPNEGRFVNHQMIIRRNGESIIHRPKHDVVLVNGFTPIIRPSSLLLSYQSVPLHCKISSSSSIINKMSISKLKQTKRIKRKRKNRRRRKAKSKEFDQSLPEQNQSLIRQLEDICFNRNTIQSSLSKNDYALEKEDCHFKENNQFYYDSNVSLIHELLF